MEHSTHALVSMVPMLMRGKNKGKKAKVYRSFQRQHQTHI